MTKKNQNSILLNDDEGDDQQIYQPFQSNRRLIPDSRESQRLGSSQSVRSQDSMSNNYLSPDRARSPGGRSGRRSPSPDGRNEIPRTPSSSGSRSTKSPDPYQRSPKSRDPYGDSDMRSIKSPDPYSKSERRYVKSPDPHGRRRSSGNENITNCNDPNCELCELVKNKNRQNHFSVSSGEVKDPDRFNPLAHTLKKNDPNRIASSNLDPTRIKPHFAKKLAQLDATMKIIATKVDNNIWEEKYLEAEELQNILVQLRKVHNKLKELLYKRQQNLEQDDLKGAHGAKVEYESALQEALDIDGIKKVLSSQEYNALLSLRNI